MVKVVLGLGVVVLALAVVYLLFRGDDEVVSAEDAWDGVHLCSPDQQEAATVEAAALPMVEPLPTGGDSVYFAQTDPAWGSQEYDHGRQQDVGCGETIAQCGCAMTSVATVMRLFEVVSTPDGDNLNPSTLNTWFNEGAQLTNGGWVSQGYTDGAVIWSAINGWTPEAATGSSERDPALSERSEGVRFAGWGSGSESEIRKDLEANKPVVLEVKGHFIAAVGLDGNEIKINDPYYRDRTTLAAYGGKILSSRRFEVSDDFRMITLTVPSNQRVQVRDEQNRVVGTLEGSTPADAAGQASTDIPGSQYHFEEAWRDPTCTERPPPPGAGVNTIFIKEPASGRYHVVVVSTDGGPTSAAVHLSDVDGNLETEAHEGGVGVPLEFDIDYDSGVEEPTATPTDTPTPTPTPTPSETPVSPTRTDTPTPTPTITPTLVPATISVSIQEGEGTKLLPGESMTICYSANREMPFELELIAPNGGHFPFIQGTAGPDPKCTKATAEENDEPGIWRIVITGEGGVSSTTFFEILEPAALMEITVFQLDPMCTGVELTWLVQGDPRGTIKISRSADGAALATVFDGKPGERIDQPSDLKDPVKPGSYVYTLTATNSMDKSASEAHEVSVSSCGTVE